VPGITIPYPVKADKSALAAGSVELVKVFSENPVALPERAVTLPLYVYPVTAPVAV
jgi:hypothetical protein